MAGHLDSRGFNNSGSSFVDQSAARNNRPSGKNDRTQASNASKQLGVSLNTTAQSGLAKQNKS